MQTRINITKPFVGWLTKGKMPHMSTGQLSCQPASNLSIRRTNSPAGQVGLIAEVHTWTPESGCHLHGSSIQCQQAALLTDGSSSTEPCRPPKTCQPDVGADAGATTSARLLPLQLLRSVCSCMSAVQLSHQPILDQLSTRSSTLPCRMDHFAEQDD